MGWNATRFVLSLFYYVIRWLSIIVNVHRKRNRAKSTASAQCNTVNEVKKIHLLECCVTHEAGGPSRYEKNVSKKKVLPHVSGRWRCLNTWEITPWFLKSKNECSQEKLQLCSFICGGGWVKGVLCRHKTTGVEYCLIARVRSSLLAFQFTWGTSLMSSCPPTRWGVVYTWE